MRVAIDQETLKSPLNRIQNLFYGFAAFALLGLVGELFAGELGLNFFFWGAVIGLSLKSFWEILTNFQYSLWTFAFGFAVYLCLSMLGTGSGFAINCYFISLTLLAVLCLIISSPLFYPRITWWEYDFRFRGELKITTEIEGKSVPGRLTDLRREAGCVVLFEKLDPGTEFTVQYQKDDEVKAYKVKVMSRRGSTLGRGYTYGVKFIFAEDNDRDRFEALSNLWKVRKKAKRLAKFKHVS